MPEVTSIFVKQPQSITTYTGLTATFSIEVDSSYLPATYQWQKSSDGTSWVNVSGETSETYSFSASSSLSGTYFRCAVTPSGESAATYSNAATLTVVSVTEDNEVLNKRGLATFWKLIQDFYPPISASEIDEVTGMTLVDCDTVEY